MNPRSPRMQFLSAQEEFEQGVSSCVSTEKINVAKQAPEWLKWFLSCIESIRRMFLIVWIFIKESLASSV